MNREQVVAVSRVRLLGRTLDELAKRYSDGDGDLLQLMSVKCSRVDQPTTGEPRMRVVVAEREPGDPLVFPGGYRGQNEGELPVESTSR